METARSLDRIFNARTLAIVGASDDPHKLGSLTLDYILRGGYTGRVYPVHPKAERIRGLDVFRSVKDVPEPLDLVVIIVPSPAVPGILRDAAARGAAGAIILSAGFRESGRPDLEAEITDIARESGLRLLGPNIQGLTYLPNKLNAVFWPVITTPGPLGIISQSGTVTAALAEWAVREEFGIAAAVNLGNQTDLCESDILDFLSTDEQPRAVAMYLEGVRDGHRFLETLRAAVRHKPVVVLKGGQSAGGARAAASHTGSLAGKWQVFKGACDQAGALCVNDLETLYDSAKALATIRPPNGPRVLILSTSGGATLLAAEAAERSGLQVLRAPQRFVEALKPVGLPPNAGLSNPMDLASLDPQVFQRVALIADEFKLADVFLLQFGDPIPGASDVCHHLANHLSASLAVAYLGGGETETQERHKMHRLGIPVFPSPERAVRGNAATVWNARYLRSRGY